MGDNRPAANFRKAERVIAQLPVVMAARYHLIQGKKPVRPRDHHTLRRIALAPLDAHPAAGSIGRLIICA